MEFRYLPMTETDQEEMLQTIGVSTTDELFQTFQVVYAFKEN